MHLRGCASRYQVELSGGRTKQRVNGQNGGWRALTAVSLSGCERCLDGSWRVCVACPGVGQAEAGVPALWGKGGDLLRECGGARAFLYTRNHFSWILSVRSLPYSAGSPVRVARANGPLEPTATYLVAGWAYAYLA